MTDILFELAGVYSKDFVPAEEQAVCYQVRRQGVKLRAEMATLLPVRRWHLGKIATQKAVLDSNSVSEFNRVWLARSSKEPDEPISMYYDIVDLRYPLRAIHSTALIASLDGTGTLCLDRPTSITPTQQLSLLALTTKLLPHITDQIQQTVVRSAR